MVDDAIMLLETIVRHHRMGRSAAQAAYDGSMEILPVRLRTVLMTSAATVFAALPLVFGNSVGQETRSPIGLTVVGGTLVSTFFTLCVVPCFYLLLSKLEIPQKQLLTIHEPFRGIAPAAASTAETDDQAQETTRLHKSRRQSG